MLMFSKRDSVYCHAQETTYRKGNAHHTFTAGPLFLVLLFIAAILPHDLCADDKKPIHIYSFGNSMSAAGGGLFNVLPALLKEKNISHVMDASNKAGECLQGWLCYNRGEVPKWRIGWSGSDPQKTIKQYSKKAADMKGFMDKIFEKEWDYIIIQAWHDLKKPDLLEYDKTMEEWGTILKTKQPNAKIILYITQDNADSRRKLVYPVADKWGWTVLWSADGIKRAKLAKPSIQITRPGDFHPNTTTMYMISCMLYAFMTGETPVGLPREIQIPPSYSFMKEMCRKKDLVPFSIPEDEARIMQEAAWEACREELARQSPSHH